MEINEYALYDKEENILMVGSRKEIAKYENMNCNSLACAFSRKKSNEIRLVNGHIVAKVGKRKI
jgi:hypothetical protein